MRHIFEWKSGHGFSAPALVTPRINQSGNIALTIEAYVDGIPRYSVRLNPSDPSVVRGELHGKDEHLDLLWSTQRKEHTYWKSLGSGLPSDTRYLLRGHISDWLRYENARVICELQEIESMECYQTAYAADCIRCILDPYYLEKLPTGIHRTPLTKRRVFTYFIHSPAL